VHLLLLGFYPPIVHFRDHLPTNLNDLNVEYIIENTMKIFSRTIIVLVFFMSIFFLFPACTNNPLPIPKQPNWSNKPVYIDAGKSIIVKAGKEFIIGFVVEQDLFPIIKEIYDSDMIGLVEEQTISVDAENNLPEYNWFLFKAIKPGETQITIEHRLHLSNTLENEKTFNVEVK
jgi:hypothetical protein